MCRGTIETSGSRVSKLGDARHCGTWLSLEIVLLCRESRMAPWNRRSRYYRSQKGYSNYSEEHRLLLERAVEKILLFAQMNMSEPTSRQERTMSPRHPAKVDLAEKWAHFICARQSTQQTHARPSQRRVMVKGH
jgi:hypothetical protein